MWLLLCASFFFCFFISCSLFLIVIVILSFICRFQQLIEAILFRFFLHFIFLLTVTLSFLFVLDEFHFSNNRHELVNLHFEPEFVYCTEERTYHTYGTWPCMRLSHPQEKNHFPQKKQPSLKTECQYINRWSNDSNENFKHTKKQVDFLRFLECFLQSKLSMMNLTNLKNFSRSNFCIFFEFPFSC